jgi:hypothetical protein
MTSNLVCQWYNSSEIRDGPTLRRCSAKVNHAPNNRNTEEVHPLEVLENLVETNTEPLLLNLFSGGCPLHLDGEESGTVERWKDGWRCRRKRGRTWVST